MAGDRRRGGIAHLFLCRVCGYGALSSWLLPGQACVCVCVPLPPTMLLSQACSECHSTWFCLRGTKQSLACIASQVFWVLVQKSVRSLKEQEKGKERKGKARESSYSNKTKAPSKDHNNWTKELSCPSSCCLISAIFAQVSKHFSNISRTKNSLPFRAAVTDNSYATNGSVS